MHIKIEISAEVNISNSDWILLKELRDRVESQIQKMTNRNRTDFGLTHVHSVKVEKE